MMRSLILGLSSLCVIAVAYFGCRTTDEWVEHSSEQLRQVLVQRQVAKQNLQRLSDGKDHPLLNTLDDQIVDIQIRLAEHLENISSHHGQASLEYEQLLIPDAIHLDVEPDMPTVQIAKVDVLRLILHARISSGAAMLALLDSIGSSVHGWPSEVRACEVNKLPNDQLYLHCVLDIYHWTMQVQS